MADTVTIYEFNNASLAGVPLAPADKKTANWDITQTFLTSQDTIAIQLVPDTDIRVSTNGTRATLTDYLIHAGEIGTEIFRAANQYPINFLKDV